MTTGRRGKTGVTADGAYRWYQARGRVSTNLSHNFIGIGAVVFWKARPGMGVGHAAIYVGNGHVASTVGNDGDKKPVVVAPMSNWGTPSGWVHPKNVPA